MSVYYPPFLGEEMVTNTFANNMAQESNYLPQKAQILNCLPPRVKSSSQSAKSHLISQLNALLQRVINRL